MSRRLLFVFLFALLFNKSLSAGQSTQRQELKRDPHIAPGRMVSQGQNVTPVGQERLLSYRLEEVDLQNPMTLQFRGKTHRFNSVLRLTVTGGPSGRAHTIWIDDAALPRVFGLGPDGIGAFIYDRSILRNGAEISVSNGTEVVTLPDRLRLSDEFAASIAQIDEEGNEIIGMISGVKVINSVPQPLIQIVMRTERAFSVKNAALQLQIGKQFFMYGLGVDPTGHILTLNLSPKEFAALKDGADVLAFYNTPDRSGGGGDDVWFFGRLKKSILRL